jgi:UrcA family protein
MALPFNEKLMLEVRKRSTARRPYADSERGDPMTYVKAFSMCTALAVTAGVLVAVAPPAIAQPPSVFVTAPADVVTRHINYADLNLASAAGERSLDHRVGGAVADLCLDATGGNDGSLNFKYSMKRCSGFAWNEARPQMDRAIQRAREIASTGSSSIAAVALTISLPR